MLSDTLQTFPQIDSMMTVEKYPYTFNSEYINTSYIKIESQSDGILINALGYFKKDVNNLYLDTKLAKWEPTKKKYEIIMQRQIDICNYKKANIAEMSIKVVLSLIESKMNIQMKCPMLKVNFNWSFTSHELNFFNIFRIQWWKSRIWKSGRIFSQTLSAIKNFIRNFICSAIKRRLSTCSTWSLMQLLQNRNVSMDHSQKISFILSFWK